MPEQHTDPRVTAYGTGYTVTTSQGTHRVLNAGDMGWGVYTGQNLDLLFGEDGPAIAADANELITGLLKADDDTRTADTTSGTAAAADTDTYAEGVNDGAAVHRGEGNGYNEQLFADRDYRKGLQDGRTAAIDEELAAHTTTDNDDSDGM